MTFQWRYDADKNQGYLLKRVIDGEPNDHVIERAIEALALAPSRLHKP